MAWSMTFKDVPDYGTVRVLFGEPNPMYSGSSSRPIFTIRENELKRVEYRSLYKFLIQRGFKIE